MTTQQVSLSDFTWDKHSGVLITELSTLNIPWRPVPDYLSVYSPTTGDEEEFKFHYSQSIDGELVSWHFKPVHSIDGVSELVVIND
jgi:hypothetical protein